MTRKLNPHCSMMGCKTKAPHVNDKGVSLLISVLGEPVRLTAFARTGMSQLLLSLQDDWLSRREFAWFCRLRQPEELFYKTLYAVFFASENELHHLLSGEMPNSFVPYYEKINKELYGGRGQLTEELPGLTKDDFLNTALSVVHSGAHTSFSALISGYAFATNPKLQTYAERFHSKVQTNIERIDWVHRLLASGINKDEVLQRYKNGSDWREELARLKQTDL